MQAASLVLEIDGGSIARVRYCESRDEVEGKVFLCWSAKDLCDAAAEGITDAGWNERVRELLLRGPPLAQGLGTLGWEGVLTALLETGGGVDPEARCHCTAMAVGCASREPLNSVHGA